MDQQQQENAIRNHSHDLIVIRKELVSMQAHLLALTEYVSAMAEKTLGGDAKAHKDRIVELMEKNLQPILSAIEDMSPSLAAILDDRTDEEIERGSES